MYPDGVNVTQIYHLNESKAWYIKTDVKSGAITLCHILPVPPGSKQPPVVIDPSAVDLGLAPSSGGSEERWEAHLTTPAVYTAVWDVQTHAAPGRNPMLMRQNTSQHYALCPQGPSKGKVRCAPLPPLHYHFLTPPTYATTAPAGTLPTGPRARQQPGPRRGAARRVGVHPAAELHRGRGWALPWSSRGGDALRHPTPPAPSEQSSRLPRPSRRMSRRSPKTLGVGVEKPAAVWSCRKKIPTRPCDEFQRQVPSVIWVQSSFPAQTSYLKCASNISSYARPGPNRDIRDWNARRMAIDIPQLL